jgi:serine protease Do
VKRWLLLLVPVLVGAYALTSRSAARPATPAATPAQLEALMQGVFIAARPAIVQLQTLSVSSQASPSNAGGDGSRSVLSVERGRATGFFISADGYALTVYHAVSGQSRLQVLTTQQELLPALVVGYDESRDLALLKVSVPRPVPFLELELKRSLKLNEPLVEIGNASDDLMQPRYGAVQEFVQDSGMLVPTPLVYSSVVLNPGDSGGAVLDFHGQVVAIGIGYAISDVRRVSLLVPMQGLTGLIEAMKRGAKTRLPGVGLHVVHNPDGGVLIDRVEPASSASEAGITQGIVTSVDGREIEWQDDYYSAIRAKGLGQRTELLVKNGAATQRFSLELR